MSWKFSWIKPIRKNHLQFRRLVLIICLLFEFFHFKAETFFIFKLFQEVPYIFNVKWSVKSRLKDLVQQFREVCFQMFFSYVFNYKNFSFHVTCVGHDLCNNSVTFHLKRVSNDIVLSEYNSI